ncbi:MAG: AMP-binding protein [bacterium]
MRNWDRLSRTELRQMQSNKLRDFVQRQVYPYSPFYRRLFDERGIKPGSIRTADDLKKLPFTTKADVAPTPDDPAKPRSIILQPDESKIKQFAPLPAKLQLLAKKIAFGADAVRGDIELEYRPIHVVSTTGRTALPTAFMFSRYDVDLLLKEAGRRIFEILKLKREDIGMNVFPYAPHLAFWLVVMAGFANNGLVFHSGGGKVLGTDRIITLTEAIKPKFFMGVPGYVYHLLRRAAEQKRDFSSVELVALGAERVTPGLKEKLRGFLNQMGAKDPLILGTLGFTEARTAFIECPARESTGYHTYPDMAIIEIIDPDTGEPVGEGEDGEIAYTCIDGRGSVVLRYRTGDYVVGGVTCERCPACGRTVPRLSSNITRRSNVDEFALSKVRGTLVDLNAFFPIVTDDPDVTEWQVEIRKKNNDPFDLDEIVLYLAERKGADRAALGSRIKSRMLQEMELAPNEIIFLEEQELLQRLGMESELKEKRIADTRPKA